MFDSFTQITPLTMPYYNEAFAKAHSLREQGFARQRAEALQARRSEQPTLPSLIQRLARLALWLAARLTR